MTEPSVEHLNPASRVYAVLASAAGQPDNLSALVAWAQVFKLPEAGELALGRAVAQHLQLLHEEVELMVMAFSISPVSRQRWEGAVIQVEHATSPINLGAPWLGYKQHLTAATLQTLAILAEVVGDDEAAVSQGELAGIEERASALLTAIETLGLSDEILAIVRRHIDMVRRAVQLYPLRGAKDLESVTKYAFVEAAHIQTILQKRGDKEPSGLWDAFWRSVTAVVSKARGRTEGAKLLQHRMTQLLDGSATSAEGDGAPLLVDGNK